jgi:hypothetical protein
MSKIQNLSQIDSFIDLCLFLKAKNIILPRFRWITGASFYFRIVPVQMPLKFYKYSAAEFIIL